MSLQFSIIVPVYNRPDEIDELLASLVRQNFEEPFEIVIVEDASEKDCKHIVETYEKDLDITYFYKENTGAGLSRNFGMSKAKGNYFIVLDSDVLVPENYLETVREALSENYTDLYGGPDAAHESFTNVQKSINYTMTSFLTTGGLRGGKKKKLHFQPRSFNMGISRQVFEKTGGFGNRKIGEDIEFSIKTQRMGFTSQLIPEAFVYHKRRTTYIQFFKQTFRFGKERPLLNRQFSGTAKITYWFPSVFIIGLFIFTILLVLSFPYFVYLYGIYFLLVLADATIQNRCVIIGIQTVFATLVQFFGYGLGFLKSTFTTWKRLTK